MSTKWSHNDHSTYLLADMIMSEGGRDGGGVGRDKDDKPAIAV